ncbi:TauD/TfdA dioxygenase family protein [Dietzia maris]|jgi:taurine dioxygenase|uniref:TauD/TfdA family dioxygenase n=1 Tax=Dietzia maris TaxID=37915 RepID=A0ABT8H1U5_9ACTN|nr:TauD/TfdA family dioxygenase [Dietzia maris]MBB0991227.1 taurine dioxygenase [Dietzia sp. SLG510A3-30A2]MDN4506431.1 TauD/TfdA family dioxygenase [Dietzia maris]
MRVTIGDHQIEFGPKRLRLRADDAPPATYEHMGVRPVTPFIGADIEGVDLAAPTPQQIAELKTALLERKVLFFRDQKHLTAHQHRDFAAHWGELEVHPILDQGEIPEVVRFDRGQDNPGMENIWHVDVTWKDRPPMGSVLRAIEVPDAGGDTLWSDMGNAYDALPDDIKERIDGLTATHDFTPSFGLRMTPEKLAAMQEAYPPQHHPVVRTHPETGRKLLFVNSLFTTEIDGVDPVEGRDLLRRLLDQVKMPDFQVRLRWAPGTVAFWDNRATQHYACRDYFPHRRVMERVAIVGGAPA